MELSLVIVDTIWRPSYVFKHMRLEHHFASSSIDWCSSQLNPKNRVDSLDISASGWRIDGATTCGTQFFAVPLQLLPNLVPLRVDVFLPDQREYPIALYRTLNVSRAVPLRHLDSIAKLELSRHLCRALDAYTTQNPDFLKQYQQLPFGSRLVFKNVTANVQYMNASIVPAHDLERKSRSLKDLQEHWAQDVSKDAWPPVLDLDDLLFVRQLHDTVSVVSLATKSPAAPMIFKSSTQRFEHLYHELRFLLTNPPHPNIMPRPLHIVRKTCLFGAKRGVIGFTIPYYPQGSIRDILPRLVQNGTLSVHQKLNWCQQITSALIHLKEQSGTFFSDLRPDNVLLSSSSSSTESDVQPSHDNNASVVLCDFEQRGNWHEWCSPEVLYRQYIENLRANKKIIPGNRWYDLVELYSRKSGQARPKTPGADTSIEDFVQAKNQAWFSLTPESQEKAQVYSLGLFIYSVFEGLSNVRKSLANSYEFDSDLQFPEMKETPPAIQQLIRHCTCDAPEWQDGSRKPDLPPPRAKRVVRVGDKFYPEGWTNLDASAEDIASAVRQTAMEWWTTELERARVFTRTEEWQSGNFGKDRPTLREVLEQLKSFS